MQRLRPLSEVECYLRCYGWRGGEDTVKVIRPHDAAGGAGPDLLAERIRLAFEAQLEAREPEAA